MSEERHIWGNWEARKIDGRWCVGGAETMKSQETAALIINPHRPAVGDGVLAMTVATLLSQTRINPPGE
jgi:hypothetical protein